VSRRHARIEIEGTQATIEDLNSKNGSIVGATRIEIPTLLHHGDKVQFGRFKFVFRLGGPPGSTETDG
jgi:pSer/pThr/pTyr-binding forkhead associated (FHA) protein